MRLEQYITEAGGRSKALDPTKAFEMCATTHRDAYMAAKDKKAIIYRGVTGVRAIMEIDPKKGSPRRSANTLNFYTLWMDNYGTFKSFPKRSQSVICSTDFFKAQGYGMNVYVLLPKNRSKIGVVKSRDIFDIGEFGRIGNDLGSINWTIHHVIDEYFQYAKEQGLDWTAPPYDRDWKVMQLVNMNIY